MYYRSINRGLSLTTSGRYTVGLLLGLGFVAISSGYNGVYLSLSLGFSILIISGLMSEKVMKFYELESLSEVIAEPNTPFSISMRARNQSPSLYLYGVENLVFRDYPKFKLLSGKAPSLMQATAFSVPPSSAAQIPGICNGLPRGLYSQFIVAQRTLYPFGLISKFKFTRVGAKISILPAFDELLAAELRTEVRRRVSGRDGERSFHSHRAYTQRDPARLLDWKKSAARETNHWVIKLYESLVDEFGVLIDVPWEGPRSSINALVYESWLSRVRTAVEVIREMNRPVAIAIGSDEVIFGYDNCREWLVEAPPFPERDRVKKGSLHQGKREQANYVRLRLTDREFHWDSEPGVEVA